MSLLPELTDEHRTAEIATASMSHESVNNESLNCKNGEISIASALFDGRRWVLVALALFFCFMNAIVVPVACLCTLYIFLHPLKFVSMTLFNRLEHELCRLVNDEWTSASKYCGLNIVEYGDDIKKIANARVLCLANHLGLIDHFCLMTSFHNKKELTGKYMWVIFNFWKWNPIGLMWTAHGNFFVQGSGIGATRRAQLLVEFKDHLINNFWRFDYGWIVMYPEGSRFYLVNDSEKRFCLKHAIQPFHYCTHPRIGAAHTVLEICGLNREVQHSIEYNEDHKFNKINYIVDCTLGYHKGIVPHFGRCLFGLWPSAKSNTVAIHYRIHKVKPEWCTNKVLFKDWLYKEYARKDLMLKQFYKTGKILSHPENENSVPLPGHPVFVSELRCIMVNFVWLALFYFHVNMWLRPCFRLVCTLYA